jgi:nucleoid DNA-binding protein
MANGTKAELVSLVHTKLKQSGVTCYKNQVDDIIDVVLTSILETAKQNDNVIIRNFGTFKVKTRPEHFGSNPRTQERITIAESKVFTFKASKSLEV